MAKKKYRLRIKEVLTEKGLTQQALADHLGLRFAAVSRYVNGHREPTLETLAEIAGFLKVSIRDLIEE